MRTSIQRWGNSLAVRIPKAHARELGLQPGGEIEMRVKEGALVMRAVRQRRPTLKELLKGVRPENLHEHISFGRPVGREVW